MPMPAVLEHLLHFVQYENSRWICGKLDNLLSKFNSACTGSVRASLSDPRRGRLSVKWHWHSTGMCFALLHTPPCSRFATAGEV
jgi:hypothetical protein